MSNCSRRFLGPHKQSRRLVKIINMRLLCKRNCDGGGKSVIFSLFWSFFFFFVAASRQNGESAITKFHARKAQRQQQTTCDCFSSAFTHGDNDDAGLRENFLRQLVKDGVRVVVEVPQVLLPVVQLDVRPGNPTQRVVDRRRAELDDRVVLLVSNLAPRRHEGIIT